jgi:hypothetical protein
MVPISLQQRHLDLLPAHSSDVAGQTGGCLPQPPIRELLSRLHLRVCPAPFSNTAQCATNARLLQVSPTSRLPKTCRYRYTKEPSGTKHSKRLLQATTPTAGTVVLLLPIDDKCRNPQQRELQTVTKHTPAHRANKDN